MNNQTINRINARVRLYEDALQLHPLREVIQAGQFSPELVREFAKLQYIDSVLWVPMLALMKDRVDHPRIKQALTDNLLCEAGAKHTSHITLAKDFVASLGVEPSYGEFSDVSVLARQPVEMMNAVIGMSEAEIAGWILVAEACVPSLFNLFLPAARQQEGVDLTYLEEHVRVDSDEHAQWMREGIRELLEQGVSEADVLRGVDLGGRTALAVPDVLYARSVRAQALVNAQLHRIVRRTEAAHV